MYLYLETTIRKFAQGSRDYSIFFSIKKKISLEESQFRREYMLTVLF